MNKREILAQENLMLRLVLYKLILYIGFQTQNIFIKFFMIKKDKMTVNNKNLIFH